MREVSGNELANLTGKTWRTVKSALESGGVQPLRREGRADLYDSQAALMAIYRPDDGGEYDDQRQRLAAAQAEKVEHENLVRRGMLAQREAVVKFWTECLANMRAKILAMASKLGPQLVNIGDASIIAAAIRAECYAALAELAEWGADGREDVVAGSEEGPAAAAGPDGSGVGRPRAKAVNGKQRRARTVAN
jgi:hypothetical protein